MSPASAASGCSTSLPQGHCPFRRFAIKPFVSDLIEPDDDPTVDRDALLSAFRNYLDANKLEVDWEAVGKTSNRTLVNSLSMMAPFGPRENRRCSKPPTSRRAPKRWSP